MHRPSIHIDSPCSDRDWADATMLVEQYFEWLADQAGLDHVRDEQPSVDDELTDLADHYRRAEGTFLLARAGRVPVATVAIVPAGPETAELVRFYCRPAARGTGVGTELLRAALDRAVAQGYETVELETCTRFMHDAVRLYERHGFVATDEPTVIGVPGMVRYRRPA